MAKPKISRARLKKLIHYNPATGVFTWIAPSNPRSRSAITIGMRAGCVLRGTGYKYRQIGIDKKRYMEHRLAWFYMTGKWPVIVDHINRNPSDNRFCNLRNVNARDNVLNGERMDAKYNCYEERNISFDKKRKQFIVQFSVHVGRFRTLKAAKTARDRAESIIVKQVYQP